MLKSSIKEKNLTNTKEAKKQPQQVTATSCGKAIISGEHAVVYGSRAVAMPLKQMRITLNIKPQVSKLKIARAANFSLKLGGNEASEQIKSVIPDSLTLLGQRPFSLEASGHSQLPIGAGLGSSASLCVVMLKALAMATHQNIPPEQLAHLSNQLEKRFHGNPSGLDTMVVAFEQVISFSRNKPTTVITTTNQDNQQSDYWHFALIDSSIRSSTLAMIEKAKPYFCSPQGDARIARFDEISKKVEKSLVQNDHDLLADSLMENSALLEQAGVVTDGLKYVLQEALRLGVKAAKTTGAGGGGCILCLLDRENVGEQIKTLRSHFGTQKVFHASL